VEHPAMFDWSYSGFVYCRYILGSVVVENRQSIDRNNGLRDLSAV
jgi:hypothetical protein